MNYLSAHISIDRTWSDHVGYENQLCINALGYVWWIPALAASSIKSSACKALSHRNPDILTLRSQTKLLLSRPQASRKMRTKCCARAWNAQGVCFLALDAACAFFGSLAIAHCTYIHSRIVNTCLPVKLLLEVRGNLNSQRRNSAAYTSCQVVQSCLSKRMLHERLPPRRSSWRTHANPGPSAEQSVDVEDLLTLYESVSVHNGQCELLHLKGTVWVWLESHEDELASWWKSSVTCSVKPTDQQLDAEEELACCT